MGAVYKAEHLLMERLVALKVINRDWITHPAALERFRREVRAAAKLSHPNIVTAHDAEQAGDSHFLVMEYVEGTSLARLLAEHGPLPVAQACDYVRQAAFGLQHAYEKGMVHRDIKPHNLMLMLDGQVKVLDFGLARFAQESRAAGPTEQASVCGSTTATLTLAGTLMGTPDYMAPEQVRDAHSADVRADVYSLGCTLFALLIGRPPFPEGTPVEKARAHVDQMPPSLIERRGDVPPELAGVVGRMMAKDPARRYQTPAEVAAALLPFTTATLPPWSLGREGIPSLAVLPTVNMSAESEMEYLSDGMTESIINLLSQLPGLRVMARSTVFRYKGRDSDAREAGQALGVGAVLAGQIYQRDGRVVIRMELVDVADGSHLWGGQYNRPMADLQVVETTIAREIAEKLHLRLTGQQKHRLSRPRTENAEAYQWYLKGRHYWNKRTAEGLRRSIKHFEQAIDADPTYALAYTGVADAYLNLGGWGHLPFREAYPRARAAATRALAIDEDLAEAHVSLAMVQKEYDWDWASAGRGYERALELNPNYAVAHQWFGEYLASLGRHQEAIASFNRAIELDPLSLVIQATLGRHGYYFARQYEQAVVQLRKTLDTDDGFWVARLWLGLTYATMGRCPEALAELQTARRLDDNLEIVATLGYTYGRAGWRLEAQQTLDELQQLSRTRYVSPMLGALIATGLGEHDQAFGWLEQSHVDRAQMMSELNAEPLFDPLRADPRFADLLRRVGLEAHNR
jgi:serine/threonine-protein kinase